MRDQDAHTTHTHAALRHLAALALVTLLTLTVLTLAICPASGGQQPHASPSPTTAPPSPTSELPDQHLTPGAVRVSASLPGCPTAYTVDDLGQHDTTYYAPWMPGRRARRNCPGPVTAAEVCATRGTRQYRHTAGVTKRSVCASYGVSAADCPGYEDDHLVPLELGGSDARENHWPQPWGSEWDAGGKDWLENELRRLVCGGVLPIERSWRCVAEEWTKCYQQAKAGQYDVMGVE